MIMLAWRARGVGEPNLGSLKERITFDSWPKSKSKVGGCCSCRGCCGETRKDRSKKFAVLHLDVEILPQEEAARNPVEHGVAIAPPKGRLDWKTAISQPGRFISVLLGPKMHHRAKVGCA